MPTDRSDLISWEAAVSWLCSQPDARSKELAHACYFDGDAVSAGERYHDSEEWAATRLFFPPPPGDALDLGAGRGISSYALARDGWRVTALEPDPSALVGRGAIEQIVEQTALDITVLADAAENIPFPDGSFDLVYCRQALHHARDLTAMCSEAVRVLRPGGVFVATREHVLTRQADLPHFLASHPLHHLYGGEHAYLLEEYVGAIKNGGASEVRVISPSESVVNLFPHSIIQERARIGELVGVEEHELPEYILQVKDHFDTTPGRIFSFRATK